MTLSLVDLLAGAERGDPIIVLYHDPCPDGFGSAYSAWTRLGSQAQYIPYAHENPPDPESLRGAYVAMCDCCYHRSDMIAASVLTRGIVVLDHHKSSQDQCADLACCEFDMLRSGSGMAWDFFHPGEARPLLIDCVQDRDLHLYTLDLTGPFCSKLDALPKTFEAWDKAARLSGRDLERFCREGSEMLAQFEAQAQSMAETATACEFFGRKTYIINAPYRFASRCGAILCAKEGCEMALIWNSADLRHAKLSLRSARGSGVDVSEIAVRLGGGGHHGASGATLPLAELAELALPSLWPLGIANKQVLL